MKKPLRLFFTASMVVFILSACSIPAVGTSLSTPVIISDVGKGWVTAGVKTFVRAEFDASDLIACQTFMKGNKYKEFTSGFSKTNTIPVTRNYVLSDMKVPENWRVELEQIVNHCEMGGSPFIISKTYAIFAVTASADDIDSRKNIEVVIGKKAYSFERTINMSLDVKANN